MYLKSLEVNGFKSFAQKTHLDFKTKISSIVGPNGSGKSNIAESFRFVLGEQSMKNMRGKKGEDLIFSGNSNVLNRGAVKVIFDNRDKSLNIDYDEVTIERIVYRDGNNEYLINNNKVRAKDVVELLTAANIGSTGHHIISQGEADKILSISAKDRKSVIEEALGLKSYVIKKNESEKKLKRTEDNLKEVKVREKINTPRIKFLKNEVEKIQKSKDLKENLMSLYNTFLPGKKKVEEKMNELLKKISRNIIDREGIEKKINKKKKELLESKETNISDKVRSNAIKEIQLEIFQIEENKISLQKDFARNEIFIEIQLKKKKDFESQKEKVEDNLKIYNHKLESISYIIHKNWQKWAKTILNSENISSELKEKWELKFVEYQNLSPEDKIGNKSFAIEILEFFRIYETGIVKNDFDIEGVKEKEEINKKITNSLSELNDVLASLSKKMRILNSNSEDADEVLSQEIEIEILKLEKILASQNREISESNVNKFNIEKELEIYKKEEIYATTFFGHEMVLNFKDKNFIGKNNFEEKNNFNILEKIMRIRVLYENMQIINGEEIMDEYNQLKKNREFIIREIEDLRVTKEQLNILIKEVSKQIEEKFRLGVEKINKEFSVFFSTLFMGGKAEIKMVNIPIKKLYDSEIQSFELGIDMIISLPNKKIAGLTMLSGGERSLTAIALLFAMSSITPPPFIILDETDAALDEANSKRYGDMVEKLSKHSQLILITHNRETMSRAGLLYGVTMNSNGISKLLSVSLEEGEKYAK